MWMFGDSFVSPLNANYDEDYHPDWTWTKQLATKLNLQTRIIAQPGISNQWISHEIINFYDEMEIGDTVVIVTTELNRNWLFFEKPSLSNLYMWGLSEFVGEKQFKIIEAYASEFYKQQGLLNVLHYEWFLHWCRSKLSSKVRLCLLPGFDTTDIHDTTDSSLALKDIDEQEFEQLMDKPVVDKRMNHMSKENHTILADKVYKFLTENEKIDLSTDFLNSETIQPVR
jgi:hypothetical protein